MHQVVCSSKLEGGCIPWRSIAILIEIVVVGERGIAAASVWGWITVDLTPGACAQGMLPDSSTSCKLLGHLIAHTPVLQPVQPLFVQGTGAGDAAQPVWWQRILPGVVTGHGALP
jgi:hypothetical protein